MKTHDEPDPCQEELARLRARVADLERAQRHAAQRVTQAEQRAAMAEASARTAWRIGTWPGGRRP